MSTNVIWMRVPEIGLLSVGQRLQPIFRVASVTWLIPTPLHFIFAFLDRSSGTLCVHNP